MATAVTLQQLQYFLSAVQHGSLSAAAEAHFIAQPSLSEQIRRLENQLGVSLFIRTNRKLILTVAARSTGRPARQHPASSNRRTSP